MPRFWLDLPEGVRIIRRPEDLCHAMDACPSLHREGALAEAARWDSAAGREHGRQMILWLLRHYGRRVTENRRSMNSCTIGQMIYLVVVSAPDGLTHDELMARVGERFEGEALGAADFVLRRMVQRGYLLADAGLYLAPGPVPPSWSSL